MNPAAELLLAAADLDAPIPPALTSRLGDTDWPVFLRLATHHRLAGLAGHRFEEAGDASVPGEVTASLRRARHANTLRAGRAFAEFDRIHSTLSEADIPCIPFKGIDLARRLYPHPGMRAFDDMDLLVPEAHVSRAVDAMRGIGYTPPSSLWPRRVLRTFHFHVALTGRRAETMVELHWRLADRDALPGPLPELFGDRAEPGLPPHLYAAYLAVHLAKHGWLNERLLGEDRGAELALHPWSDLRLIWFVDLRLLMKRAALVPADVAAAAREWGCEARVRCVLDLAEMLFRGQRLAPPAVPGRGGLQNRLLARMRRDLDGPEAFSAPLPWLLRPHRGAHVRPIRLFTARTRLRPRKEPVHG